MIDENVFREQLYEFVSSFNEPFDIGFLERHTNVWVDRARFYDALFKLESEGKIVRLSDGRYAPVKLLMRKWIRERLLVIELPYELFEEVKKFIFEYGLRETPEQFILTAIERLIMEMRRCRF